MMRIKLLIGFLLLSSQGAWAQNPWTGIISPSRAINWKIVGAVPGSPGTLPDTTWTKCGSTIAPYGTSGSPASTSAINTVISGCAAHTYVLLGAGSFYLTGAIIGKNQVAVRGMGANSTLLAMYTNGSGQCNGQYAAVVLCGDSNYYISPENVANWTAGFSQGSTSITVSNSLNITANSTFIILDQQDTPDSGNLWTCTEPGNCASDNSGGARTTGTCSSSVSPFTGFCTQQERVLVTACSPSCNNSGSTTLTISPGLADANWASANSTGAWWATTQAYEQGVEDMSIDLSNLTASTSCVAAMNSNYPFISGIRCIQGGRSHILFWDVSYGTVMSNYFYENLSHATQSYAMELFEGSSYNLILNNIYHRVTDSTPSNTSGGVGNTAAFNYAVQDVFASAGWFQPSDFEHSGGDFYWLREGNDTLGLEADDIHGTHNLTTLFRNRYPGWQTIGCGGAGATCPGSGGSGNSTAVNLFSASRYFNVIANVLGQTGYAGNYTALGPSATNQNTSVYYLSGIYSGNPAGTVNTSGTAVTWNSGTLFNTAWTGGWIINNVTYTISSCSSTTSCTLTTSAGTQTNVQWWGGSFCSSSSLAAGNCSQYVTNYDPLTQTSLFRWGNWDSVNNAVLECTALHTPITACTGNERGNAFGDTTGTTSAFVGLTSPATTFPNSFFLTANTTSGCGTGLGWWKNPTTSTCPPFPTTGPDITGGNIGICTGGTFSNSYATNVSQCGGGTLSTAWGGHANADPAMSCYLNVMNGAPDGSSSVLTFNRASCYANDPALAPPSVTAPTGLTVGTPL